LQPIRNTLRVVESHIQKTKDEIKNSKKEVNELRVTEAKLHEKQWHQQKTLDELRYWESQKIS
jgi:hypothetical protein